MTFCIWSCVVLSQDHIQFKNYTITDGLSQSVIYAIEQDDLGALWLGTQDGINRFNGRRFEIFSTDENFSISSDYIHVIKKDQHGNLWMGSYNGLIQYSKKDEIFRSFTLDAALNERLDIHALTVDEDGLIWTGTATGEIFQFHPENETFKKIPHKINATIVDILCTKSHIAIAGQSKGLLLINKTNLTDVQYFGYKDFFKNGVVVNKFIRHPSIPLLLATNKGLIKLEPALREYSYFSESTFQNLGALNIKDALFLSENWFFIASENNGLFQFNYNGEDYSVQNYKTDFFQKRSLVSDKLIALYQDKKGVIWVTSQRGLSSFDPYNKGIRGIGLAMNPSSGLISLNVWGFDEDDKSNKIFIAGDHGVSLYHKIQKKYFHFPKEVHKGKDNTVLCIKSINDQDVLVGGIDGLKILNIASLDPLQYNYKNVNFPDSLGQDFSRIYKIIPFSKPNTYLIGTFGGLVFYDHAENDFQFIRAGNHDQALSEGAIRLVFKDNDDKFYVSPSGGGVYEVKLNDQNKIITLRAKTFDPLTARTKNYFSSFLQTDKNEFWFGSSGDGLFYFNSTTNEVKQFNKTNGLPNNVIYGIEKSTNGKVLWLSTNRGMVKFQRGPKTFTTFLEEDGLMSNELNIGASYTSKDGIIYFGGIQGYNYFDPSYPLIRTAELNVFFSSLVLENIRITPASSDILEQSISYTRYLNLPFNKRSIQLFFFADDLSNPSRVEYKYRLTGEDEIEEFIGTNGELRFTSIAPGEYKLQVFARNYGGAWNKQPAELTIRVEKPFWYAWWFYALLITMISFFIYLRVRTKINNERRQQVRLELKIAERTREIREKSAKIEQQKKVLEEQKVALEREKEKSERLLNNILPSETATQLKNFGKSTARDFNLVTVMFTDFVGFTGIAENMKAKDLVTILDEHFKKFDEIIEDLDLEKIKTIGDAYMCAGGVPIRNRTNPIHCVLAALRIQTYMKGHNEKVAATGGQQWQLRIGINTGPVSAGVIGTKRYAYDIWGRTVNRAQRMERYCTPGKIAISEDTYDYIQPYFICKPKGMIPSKSGLNIQMYEVERIKPELSVNAEGIFPNEAFQQLVNLHFFSKINYLKAEKFILNKLKNELSPKLHYHSFKHSKDVTKQAERIALSEGITDEDLFLLKTAATYHDAGFIERYDKNEPIGAKMAEEILPKFGYTKAHIERIKELIFVTQIPHQPKNKLEEIMCDADLDYLGRSDFHTIADLLRRELREHGKINSDREWDRIQVSFLTQHRYFTKTSILSRRPKKLQNLEDIKKRLERNEYAD